MENESPAFVLDGAVLDFDTRDFTFKVPAPFGPNGKSATLTITARPLTYHNQEYADRIAELNDRLGAIKDQIGLEVRTKKNQRTTNNSQKVVRLPRYAKELKDIVTDRKELAVKDEINKKTMKAQLWFVREYQKIVYQTSIIKWETDIQSNGKSLEPTEENWINLFSADSPEIQLLQTEIHNSLSEYSEWKGEIEGKIEGKK